MQIFRGFRLIGVLLFLGLLAGCGEVTPEKIEEWKAQGSTSKLIGSLSDTRQFIRIDAIAALKELDAKEAVEPLGNLLSDPDPVIIHKTLDALAQIGGPSIEKYMLEAITFNGDPARATAATALGVCKSTAAVQPLIVALNDDYETVIVAAATSLGQIGDTQAIEALVEKAKDPSYKIRLASINSLCQIGGVETTESLATALGDVSDKIRTIAIGGLITIGKPAVPYALESLRGEGEFTRSSAISVLKGIGTAPTSGSDFVWYTLARISTGPKDKIDPAIVDTLAGIDGGTDALLHAIMHPDNTIYDYGFRALIKTGKPAVTKAVAKAEQGAGEEGKVWFSSRIDWKGAPSWRLDLWSAAVALNPRFKLNPKVAKTLSKYDSESRNLLSSSQFKPTPEYVPLLIEQCKTLEETGKPSEGLNRSLAEKKLRGLGTKVVLPLIAALNDPDINVASSCSKLLVQLDNHEFKDHLTEAFAKKVNNNEDLSGSELYSLVVQLNDPVTEPLLLKVRPNEARAIQVFEKKYPGVRVSIATMRYEIDPTIKAQPFRLKYLVSGKSKELKVIFRPDTDGNWAPTPPLPEQLP